MHRYPAGGAPGDRLYQGVWKRPKTYICQNDLKLLQDEQELYDHSVNLLDWCWKSLILEVNQIWDLKSSCLPVPGSNHETGGVDLD